MFEAPEFDTTSTTALNTTIFNRTLLLNTISINNVTFLYTERELKFLYIMNYYVYELVGAIVFTLGVIFNILSFTYFQLSRSFKDTSMRYYFSVISITDSLRLIEWPLIILIDKRYINLSVDLCRVLLFTTTVSGLISIWLLTVLSIERYVMLQFPFRGKIFYTIKTSIKILIFMIILPIAINIPFFIPNTIRNTYSNYDINLYMCNINPKYHIYMFFNTVVLYSLIPFIILLIFNCLLICFLAKQKRRQLHLLPQTTHSSVKQDKKFKEKTILLIIVSFLLILTLSPRYIVQMMLFFSNKYQSITIFAITKCLIVLEMFNFSFNFFFYILCSKTSRYELYLIFYYLFYWRWSKQSTVCYCNNCMSQLYQQQQLNGGGGGDVHQQQHYYHRTSLGGSGTSSGSSKASFSAINSQYQYIKRLSQQSTNKVLPPINSSNEEEPLKEPHDVTMCVKMDKNKTKIKMRFNFINFKNQQQQQQQTKLKRNKFCSSSLNTNSNKSNNNNNNEFITIMNGAVATTPVDDYAQINQSTAHIHHSKKEQGLQTFLLRHSSLSSRFPLRHGSLKC